MSRILENAQLLNPRRTGAALATCLAVAAVVAGCGGGDRVKAFQPTQIIAFGDENSAFDDTTTTTHLVSFEGLPATGGATASTATVPYKARYTINLVADAQFRCKNAMPDKFERAGCATPNVPTSALLAVADYPNTTSLFVPQSTVLGYRLDTGIPIVNEVQTGSFNDAASPALTVYQTTDHTYYCSVDFGNDFGNWVQRVAHGLGGGALTLGGSAGCAQDSGNSRSYAEWGAKVDQVGTQVDNHIGELHNGVLVTMLAGQNDIMDAFKAVMAGADSNNAHIDMREKGVQLARIINKIVGTGARVAYLTVPDMGRSPEAVAKPALASTLTKAFNEGYKATGEDKDSGGLAFGTIINNGHKVVKVEGYTLITALGATYGAVAACETDVTKVKMPNGVLLSTLSLSDDDQAKALLLNCRSNNLKVITPAVAASGSSPATAEVRAYYGSYLWADGRRLGPVGHANLANLAVARIRDQL